MMIMKVLVIADDFTGANDTGLQFHQQHISVDVLLSEFTQYQGTAEVVVVNTDSRAMNCADAQQAIYQVFAHAKAEQVYKKMDSTLRGNIGAELAACLSASERKIAFVCSALPKAGRVVRDGILYVNDVPLLETEFATDPKTPIVSSSVKAIIGCQTDVPVFEFKKIAEKNTAVSAIYSIMAENTQAIISFDAESEQDLQHIAELIKEVNQPCIVAGSSGLAQSIAAGLSKKPILFVVGSMSEVSGKQVDYIKDNAQVATLAINIKNLLQDQWYIKTLMLSAKAVLNNHQHLLLKTESSLNDRLNISLLCAELNCSRTELGNQISQKIALFVSQLLEQQQYQFSVLFLTGGDIAFAVAKQLQLDHYQIAGEIEAGVPYGYFPNSPISAIPVMTKAGGFGSVPLLQRILDYFN
ncbi:four-carbon acid sugar kinase family protein [Lonepinella sp. BR2919]|uniref:four-carbon acid sugar kinase family protein n=2 Tax=unclassified Lonepinella TaxID=2642006 RepID=UPI003F6DAF6B